MSQRVEYDKKLNTYTHSNFMKNTIKFLMGAILALAFVGCTETPSEQEQNRLSAPEFSCRVYGKSVLVSWSVVSGAAYYEIKLNANDVEKTDKFVHKFEGLDYDTTYTVALRAVSANEQTIASSEFASKQVTIEPRKTPAYREWYTYNQSAAEAISDNGLWVAGGRDGMGMIINLVTDELTEVEACEFKDITDNGVAVGCYKGESIDGEAALYVDGEVVKVDLSNLTTTNMSMLTGITPDGTYAVGWYQEFEDTYYSKTHGMIVPFCYDVVKKKVTIPAHRTEGSLGSDAMSLHGVTPDRKILGCLQTQQLMISVLWQDEYTPYDFLALEVDEEGYPQFILGDNNNHITQLGNYVYGYGKTFMSGGYGESSHPAVLDTKTKEVFVLKNIVGSTTAVTDDGIAFINDTPYYLGTTSFVVDVKEGSSESMVALEKWLLDEHQIDVNEFEPSCNETIDDPYTLEGVITIGASADGRKLLGITQTNRGWMTYVIDLDGVKTLEE